MEGVQLLPSSTPLTSWLRSPLSKELQLRKGAHL